MPTQLFTPESAKLLGIKSGEARRAKRQAIEKAALEAAIARKADKIQGNVESDQEPAESQAKVDQFQTRTLARVRKQISRLLALMESETDMVKLERVTSALAKLEEMERRLSDRKLPATLRVQDKGAQPGRAALLLRREPGDREKGPRIEQR